MDEGGCGTRRLSFFDANFQRVAHARQDPGHMFLEETNFEDACGQRKRHVVNIGRKVIAAAVGRLIPCWFCAGLRELSQSDPASSVSGCHAASPEEGCCSR